VRARAAAAGTALALALCGCAGGGPPPEPAPAPTGTGYFVGTGPAGIGATLDLEGRDRVTAAVGAALRLPPSEAASAPAVGIASVVNEGPRALPAPVFAARFANGGATPLRDAASVVSEEPPGPARARALRLLGEAPRVVPADGAVTMYVVLRGATAAEVESVRMTALPGQPVTLGARAR
jgi:hypothetical protein